MGVVGSEVVEGLQHAACVLCMHHLGTIGTILRKH